jgi:hypothetical protein
MPSLSQFSTTYTLALTLHLTQASAIPPTTNTTMFSRSPTSSELSQNEKITLYVVAGVGGLLIILGLVIGILRSRHQACNQARVQSILKKFPIIQYDYQRTPKSSFDGSVDSEEEEKACVETHTKNHNHTCPVCTEDFVQYQFLRVLPCGHQYHVKCIEDWLARGSNCPVWYVSAFHPRWRCSKVEHF